MIETKNKAWALIDNAAPVEIDGVKLWLKVMTNGQKILLAKELQDGANFDATMTSLANNVTKMQIDGKVIEDNEQIVKMFVSLDNFTTQNKILETIISITGLRDVERKNSPSSSAI